MQAMVKCAKCGAMVPPERAFCPNCHEPMEVEEQRRSARPIENMAATVVGFSLNDLNDNKLGGTQMLSREELKKMNAPAAPEPPRAERPAPPAEVVHQTGAAASKNKTALIIGGIIVVVGLLALVVLFLVGTGVLRR